MQRYFVEDSLEEEYILMDKDIIHHITNVMRNKVGDNICLVNKRAVIYSINTISTDQVSLNYLFEEDKKRELKTNITLCAPLLKKDNFELILQKTVELGVRDIWALETRNSVVRLDQKKFDKKKNRYQDIIKSASMQSQRTVIPNLLGLIELKNLDITKYDLVICEYEQEEEVSLLALTDKIKEAKDILVIVGPEGGFTELEIEKLVNDGINIITLGGRILRAETACINIVGNLSMIIEGVIK